MHTKTSPRNSVAIIGGRNFSPTNLYSLLTGGAVEELIVLDDDGDELADAVKKLEKVFPPTRPARIAAGDYRDAAAAAIVIIAVGNAPEKGDSELDALSRNAGLVRAAVRRLTDHKFSGVLLMTTNPVDIMAQIALGESSLLSAERVIGSGKISESGRFDQILAGEAAAPGEPATWCAAKTGSRPLVDFCRPDCPDFGAMLAADRRSPPENVREKDYPPLTVAGSCITRICEAILGDERAILPVCAKIPEKFGYDGAYLNLPAVIGRGGIEQILRPELTEAERLELLKRADFLQRTGDILRKDKSSAKLKARK